jgi:hemoglobin
MNELAERSVRMGEPSLYERLGGVYAISAVVDRFSAQLVEKGTIEAQNSNIKDWNENEASSRLPGLRFLRTLWLCAIAGGPFEYTGLPLEDAHSDLRLSSSDFDQVAAVLADTLDDFNVPAREKEEVLGAFEAHKPEVTAGAASRT